MRHFLTLNDFSKEEIIEILNLAIEIKKEAKDKNYKPYLKEQSLAMIFEKSSTRTRVSFDVGMYQLGGHAMFLSSNDIQIGRGEPIKDTARVISGMCDMAMLRVNRHETLVEFAKFSKIPVINGLSDKFHPVQLMADMLTMIECGLKVEEIKAAYVGDGNNMTHSWLMLASKLGFELRVATPKGYEADAKILAMAQENAKISGAKIIITNDIKEVISGANVVTTDTWVSMGQEAEKEKRIKEFAGFCVDSELMKLADKKAIFLHCLPAYRGYEVSEEVFEAHADEIFAEAENRLHAQKGVMVWLDKHR
ncbi:ornithine carbamoyltransferase [Campylobacter sp. RM9344]|uniref:Ornithine carbamoyltransferase n=1 Tax=Campylobacter californiensis TaxID=1032243 RepID=A0AAW3ZYP4_9BACT|nr:MULTISPECIES: ornithine carbamoyltransferase [unclassified Campylobacter]MBE2984911.1 ornithine carbamoyltransferase [Campylobacter sp. RM6883]MBE2995313.1 ornithine carbamoyltransferase [Campylobacter sp. RM6913]MBE3029352.1 ornithine carbamoyltransferase [Campylobacter sp. RM9344]MBE3608515.1 ornithine carbamoyltransferase [Campylobacter sp. RM9337]QCD51194.1 ornithine carbamoyltransferase [Campylobacter sp. RM6914]